MTDQRLAIVAGVRTPFVKAGQAFATLGPLALAKHAVRGRTEGTTMSRTIHPHALRTLALVGLLGVARLVAPAATPAQSITPEQALLNRTAVGPSGAVTADPVSSPAVDGAWRSLSTILSLMLSLASVQAATAQAPETAFSPARLAAATESATAAPTTAMVAALQAASAPPVATPLATPAPVPAIYEAHVAGAATAALRGTAEFGPARGAEGTGPWVLTLGANGEDGAVIFTRWSGRRPSPGIYEITAEPTLQGIQALVVTGSTARPTGVFRAQRGTVTITSSADQWMSGRFEMEAVGFLASEPDREDRGLTVKGTFTASPSR